MELTPEIARQILAGQVPLRSVLGVAPEQLARMASFGYELWQQGRRHEARTMFEALVAADENVYYGHAGLGLVAMREEDFESARRHLARAVAIEPGDAAVAVNYGEALLRLGKLPEAIAVMEKAANLDPSRKTFGSARAAAILAAIGQGMAEISKTAESAQGVSSK